MEILACHVKQKYYKWKASSKPSREGTKTTFARGFFFMQKAALQFRRETQSVYAKGNIVLLKVLQKHCNRIVMGRTPIPDSYFPWNRWHLGRRSCSIDSLLGMQRKLPSVCLGGGRDEVFQHNSHPSWGTSPNPHFNFITAVLKIKEKKTVHKISQWKKINPTEITAVYINKQC